MLSTEDKIIYLSQFMLPERFERMSSRISLRTRHMLMCLEDIFYPHNASAVIRSAEAFGLQQIHVVESITRFLPSKHIVRGTDQWVDIRKWPDTPALVGHLREQGYRIVVTSPHEGGSTPENFDILSSPFALFMGTEKTGISEWLMSQADDYIQIPMVGFAESLNISVSAAIIAQRLTERIRQSSLDWQLSPQQQQQILLRWMVGSVKDAQRILELEEDRQTTNNLQIK